MKHLITLLVSVSAMFALANEQEQPFVIFPEIPKDEYCLALNIYHEARSENLAGMYAVSDVVLNRVESSRYPDTVCDVVHQAVLSKWHLEERGKEVPVRNKCQFSWYCDGKSDAPTDMDSWYQSRLVANQMIRLSLFRGITEGATHYHANYVDPSWRKSFHSTGRIGSHIFYRADR